MYFTLANPLMTVRFQDLCRTGTHRKSQVWSWHLRGGHWNGGVRYIKERLYHRVVAGMRLGEPRGLEAQRGRVTFSSGERVSVCRRVNVAG